MSPQAREKQAALQDALLAAGFTVAADGRIVDRDGNLAQDAVAGYWDSMGWSINAEGAVVGSDGLPLEGEELRAALAVYEEISLSTRTTIIFQHVPRDHHDPTEQFSETCLYVLCCRRSLPFCIKNVFFLL